MERLSPTAEEFRGDASHPVGSLDVASHLPLEKPYPGVNRPDGTVAVECRNRWVRRQNVIYPRRGADRR